LLSDKKILFAAGGTGGHINPALAVAGLIREKYPGAKILFVGTKEKIESRLVPAAGFDFKTIDISGFQRSFTPENIKRNLLTVSRLLRSSAQAKELLLEFRPDVVVGFGGYVSGPVLRMAAKMSILTAIHEQNAYPGVTNKALANRVDRVMLTAVEAEKYLKPKNPCVYTGLPVRGEIVSADRTLSRFELGLDDRPLILSMGGSLGAQAINENIVELIARKHRDSDCYFHHATGQYGKWVPDSLQKKGVDLAREKHIIIREYIDDMYRLLSAADLVICRSGASTLSELQAAGKASILIPSPNVAENHQYHNAMAMAEQGAAILIEEKDLTPEKLIAEVNALISDPGRRQRMEENAKKMAAPDSAERICKVIEDLCLTAP